MIYFVNLKVLLDLIRKTKEIVRDLDNLQYRKMKKIIMIDGNSSSSGGINGSTTKSNTLNITDKSRVVARQFFFYPNKMKKMKKMHCCIH